jgi:hypothetical protein
MDYMKINANDQLDLQGSCLSGCDINENYYNYTLYMLISNQWIPLTNTSYFFYTGLMPQTSLNVKEDLFQDYPLQKIWKIELNVFVPSKNTSGSTSIKFYVNFPPQQGSCDINPKLATTNTSFSISCMNWVDPDGILSFISYYSIIKFIFSHFQKPLI